MGITKATPPDEAKAIVTEAINNSTILDVTRTFMKSSTDRIELTSPLPIYTLGMDELTSKSLNNAQIKGWQYVAFQDDEPVGGAELDINEDSELRFSNLNSSPYNIESVRMIMEAEQSDIVIEKDFEARLLKIPDLYVIAVWLHNEEEDILIPLLPTNENLESNKMYSPETLFEDLGPSIEVRRNFNFKLNMFDLKFKEENPR
jgi:hypothetical protein